MNIQLVGATTASEAPVRRMSGGGGGGGGGAFGGRRSGYVNVLYRHSHACHSRFINQHLFREVTIES